MNNKAILILLAVFSISNFALAYGGGFSGLPGFSFSETNYKLDLAGGSIDKNFDVVKSIADCSAAIANQKNVVTKRGYVIVAESACQEIKTTTEQVYVNGNITFLK